MHSGAVVELAGQLVGAIRCPGNSDALRRLRMQCRPGSANFLGSEQ